MPIVLNLNGKEREVKIPQEISEQEALEKLQILLGYGRALSIRRDPQSNTLFCITDKKIYLSGIEEDLKNVQLKGFMF